jgi:predicted dehydrogenase
MGSAEQRKMRVGLVGCGAISGAHLDAYRQLGERFEVAAVCDIVEEKARRRAAEFGVERALRDVEDLYRLDVDVIDVCTPPYLHAPISLAAMQAGKHVFCEKPLAGALAEVDALAAAEQRAGRRVMPIFNYRFGFGLQRLKHVQEQGLTGRLVLSTVETHWLRPQGYFSVRWRAGWRTALGGAFIGHAIHAHDALYHVAGPARSVFARAKTLAVDVEVEDTLAVAAEMADGSLATLSVTFGSAVEISRHRYCFQNLVAESNTSPYASHTGDPWQFKGVSPEVDRAIAAALAEFQPRPPEGFVGQFQRFADAYQAGEPLRLPATLADARRAIELVTAVYYSADTGQSVELPITDDHPYYASCIPGGAAPLETWTDYAGHSEQSGWKPKDV